MDEMEFQCSLSKTDGQYKSYYYYPDIRHYKIVTDYIINQGQMQQIPIEILEYHDIVPKAKKTRVIKPKKVSATETFLQTLPLNQNVLTLQQRIHCNESRRFLFGHHHSHERSSSIHSVITGKCSHIFEPNPWNENTPGFRLKCVNPTIRLGN